MPDLAAVYAETKETMTKLVRKLDDDQLHATVPACPAWTVRDLIAHVTSIATSLATGEFPPDLNPVASLGNPDMAELRDKFVDAALEARRHQPIEAILEEWSKSAAVLDEILRGDRPWPDNAPPLGDWVVTTDLSVHHHDLRGAIGEPGERDSLATGLSLRSYVEGMRFRSTMNKLPAFRIIAGERAWTVGEGEPVATVTADPFELARAVSGRRSPDQVRAFGWNGDPEPFIDLFYPYGVREEALVE
jgi:uncharacterized protein (TIGR03083 family)